MFFVIWNVNLLINLILAHNGEYSEFLLCQLNRLVTLNNHVTS